MEIKGTRHPNVANHSPKVAKSRANETWKDNSDLPSLHKKLWEEKIFQKTGIGNYEEMLKIVREKSFPRVLNPPCSSSAKY